MKFPEILQVLHQMQKDTSRLLFEAQVSESETIRKAVAKADLALGNAASLVREQLCAVQRGNGNCTAAGLDGRYGKASPRKPAPAAEKSVATPQFAVQSKAEECELPVASGFPEDVLPDDEYAVHLGQSNWDHVDTAQDPNDRPRP